MWHWKRTSEPLQISINRGPQPRERGILEIQIFFKTSSSSKKTLSRVLNPPSSTLEVYQEQSSIESSLNAPLEFFNNTLKANQRYSSKNQITISRFAIHAQIRVLAKHKSMFDFSNKSSHNTSNPREELDDCHILLKEYIT